MTRSLLTQANERRLRAIASTADSQRRAFEQYLTPPETAAYAASMFNASSGNAISCLDLGAGSGMLSMALIDRFGAEITLTAIELDPVLARTCSDELCSTGVRFEMLLGDALTIELKDKFDKVILNPPYSKMAAKDSRQELLPVKCANLYAAFVVLAIKSLKDNGECVAIIPRSWTNGDYFAPFRNWIFENASIDWMHVYDSRKEVFSDTNVLQETMLVKLSKRPQRHTIKVTESHGKNDAVSESNYPANELICGLKRKKVVRIKPAEPSLISSMQPLSELGMLASTGKIVDFRSRDKTCSEPGPNCVPLVYSCNFSKEGFYHPVDAGKMQWYRCQEPKDEKLLIGPGAFVVVKRFSSKEEQKRIKAFAFFPEAPIALENHQNYIHCGTSRNTIPLEKETAKGLSIWLNSSIIDSWFRSVSGSTQVNASDLNQIPTPSTSQLRNLSTRWTAKLTQKEIDIICEELINE
ncbi:Eco57I restriction-modification methylase domain-containing protein [Collinsella sp. D33t1_170424_A12]|uniref:Eco57I restriction-modification methylase domain-containing protein n=1 Tax=Collinsella sp. D33t1_170424_A12 TaxID=2787135 RepID=UPI00189A58DE